MKVISIDMDGTLLDSKHIPSEKAINMIKKAQEKGIKVILNTGRSIEDVVCYPELESLKTPIFCLNGSRLYDENRDCIHEAVVPTNIYFDIMEKIKDFKDMIAVTFTNKGVLPVPLDDFFNLDEIVRKQAKASFQHGYHEKLKQYEEISIYKIFIQTGQPEELKKIKEVLNDFQDINYSSSYEDNVEVNSIFADKGQAIRKYEELVGKKFSHIFAMGDGGNDLSHISIADISFAMGNAPDYVKEKATFVTKTNDEHGVAQAIEYILDLEH